MLVLRYGTVRRGMVRCAVLWNVMLEIRLNTHTHTEPQTHGSGLHGRSLLLLLFAGSTVNCSKTFLTGGHRVMQQQLQRLALTCVVVARHYLLPETTVKHTEQCYQHTWSKCKNHISIASNYQLDEQRDKITKLAVAISQ